jgi:hypothetical protein
MNAACKGFLGFLLTLVLVHAFLIGLATNPSLKGESNYFSTLARLQAAARVESPQIAFVGSSLTGRFPMGCLGRRGINLGCDGGSSLDSLLLLSSGGFQVPPHVVVEANVLESDSTSLRGIAEGGWFKLGVELPVFSAAYRPSSLLYRCLKQSGSNLDAGMNDRSAQWATFSEKPEVPEFKHEINAESLAECARITGLVHAIKKTGCRVMVVWIPNGRGRGELLQEQVMKAQQMAADCNIPFFDLRGLDELKLVDYTDGVHLDESSAANVVRLIERQLDP